MGKDTGTSGFRCQYRAKPYPASVEELTATAEDAGTFRADTRIEILRKDLRNGKTTYRGSVRERNKCRKYVNYLSETALRTIHAGRLAAYSPRSNHAGDTGRAKGTRVRIQGSQSENRTEGSGDPAYWPRVEMTAKGKSDEENPDTGNPVPLQL